MSIKKALHQSANSHHAYLVSGDHAETSAAVREYVETLLSGPAIGHPDLTHLVYDSMGIDEARALRDMATTLPVAGPYRFFIIETFTLTREAQNALLKLFEDPNETSRFFLLVPNTRTILPTLLSRVHTIENIGRPILADDERKRAEKFLSATPRERLGMIEPMIKKLDDADEKRIQRRNAVRFIRSLETVVAEKIVTDRSSLPAAQELSVVSPYLDDISVNTRMILEHLALVL